MLVVSVDGNSKQASRTPFEGVLLSIPLPDRSGAVALGHVDHFFIEMFLWLGFALRRDLANVAVVYAAGAVEHHKRARHTLEIPRHEFDLVNIFDEKSSDYRNLLRRLPIFISIDPVRLEIGRLLSVFRHRMVLLNNLARSSHSSVFV